MKGRANASKTLSNFLHLKSESQFPCDKHPFSSISVGICPHCLKERLSKLVCSDCGERRATSCSCSQILFHRNSCSSVDVGRISFPSLRRSSSSSIKGLFGKRREKIEFCSDEATAGIWDDQINLEFIHAHGDGFQSLRRSRVSNTTTKLWKWIFKNRRHN